MGVPAFVNAARSRSLLDRFGLVARRDLGQNFLCDDAIAARLVTLSGVGPDDTVVEIGTGLGTLTCALAARAARVVTLEIDAGLVRVLRAESVLPDGVELVHADVLKTDLRSIVEAARPPVRVVGNLPYVISAPVLRRLLDLRERLTDWSVMLQREVAERLRAAPGSRAYGSLAALHHLCVDVKRVQELAPGCFHPVPRVRSTFLRLIPRTPPALAAGELPWVERVVRGAFAKRRKTLLNSLRGEALGPGCDPARLAAALAHLGIDSRARAESLGPEQLLALARELAKATPP